MRRTVIVTGATGFVGQHLIRALLDEHYNVIALCNRTSLPSSFAHSEGALRVTHNLTEIEQVGLEAFALFHLAAYIPANQYDASEAERCFQINALLTLQLAELALKLQVRKFFYCSSGQIYAYTDHPSDENAPAYPSYAATYYLGSKLLGELYVENFRLRYGLPAASFRLGSCYGAGMNSKGVVARFMDLARDGQSIDVWNGGTARADYIYVADIVRTMLVALGRESLGVYNLGTGMAPTVLELAQAVVQTYWETSSPINIKPTESISLGFAPLDSTRAVSELDFQPLPLLEGLKHMRHALEEIRS